ncbi:hypothetical protein E2986_14089 [Frieseomelitta varia]|uniref:F5/8 type C domain-containing protein n=1 Tax=Frieseomelitta varia TaxID=561572 RepID=A0A833R4N2_9HYME|nr:hypothetical protein E2986_14089 [Frieseomelitta varia]
MDRTDLTEQNLILDSSYFDLSNNLSTKRKDLLTSLGNCVCPQVIKGNTNTYLESKHELEPPMWASKVRFWPYSYHRRTVCMRVELYGCPWNDGIVSYSMPQGDKRGNWEFFDATYDGYWDGQLLRGLGQLTDGKIGPDNFKMSYYDYDRGQGWVGWRNDTRSGHPLEIKFEFDHVREFSAVHIFCNNQFTKDVQVFSEASIMFSVGGRYYTGDPIVYSYMEDRIFEHSRNISIKLHHRIGKFVKLRFGFASRWIMISEITFDSDIAHGNFTPESPTTTEVPRLRDRISARDNPLQAEVPVVKQDDPTYMAVIIGVLTAVILLLAVAIFLIVTRHRQRKNFASPLGTKSAIPSSNHQHLSPESAYGTTEKDPSLMTYRVEELDDRYAGTKLTTLPRDLNDRLLGDVRLDEYQEPFYENKHREPPHAAYYGYSTVVIDNKDLHDNVEQSDATYDYAVPMPVPSVSSDQDSVFSKSSSRGSAKACLQSFFPPPPPPMSAPPPRGSSNLTYSNPPSPEPVCERERRGSKRREHSLHRYGYINTTKLPEIKQKTKIRPEYHFILYFNVIPRVMRNVIELYGCFFTLRSNCEMLSDNINIRTTKMDLDIQFSNTYYIYYSFRNNSSEHMAIEMVGRQYHPSSSSPDTDFFSKTFG